MVIGVVIMEKLEELVMLVTSAISEQFHGRMIQRSVHKDTIVQLEHYFQSDVQKPCIIQVKELEMSRFVNLVKLVTTVLIMIV